MAEQNLYHAVLAASWDGTEEQLSEAESLVCRLCEINNWKPPAHLRRDIQEYYTRRQSEGSPCTHYSNAGRPDKLSQEQAQLIITELLSYREHGRKQPYSSIQQLAVCRPAVQTVLDDTGITIDGIIKHLHKARPTLRYVKLVPKKKLTAEYKQRRLAFSRQALRETNDQLMATVQVDAKGMPMQIGNMHGWVDDSDDTWAAEVTNPQMRKGRRIWLFYYIAVCGCAGPVFLYYYTGTTGLKACRDGITFLVGGHAV